MKAMGTRFEKKWIAAAILVTAGALCALGLGRATPMATAADDEEMDVAVVGLDEDGREVAGSLPAGRFFAEAAELATTLSDSALLALERNPDASLDLETFTVSAGGGLEAGVGGILKVKVAPRFKLVFTRAAEAVLP